MPQRINKFRTALDALGSISANTEETNKTILQLLQQEKKNREQDKRDRTAEDKKDKVLKNPLAGVSGKATGTLAKEGGSFLAMAGGLLALAALNSKFLDLENLLDRALPSLSNALKTAHAVRYTADRYSGRRSQGAGMDEVQMRADETARLKAEREAKLKAELEAERRKTNLARQIDVEVKAADQKAALNAEAEARARTQAAEVERFKRAQQVAEMKKAELQKIAQMNVNKTIQTDVGPLRITEFGQIINEKGQFTKVDDSLRAIARAQPGPLDVPEFESGFINKSTVPPVQKRGRGSVVEKPNARASWLSEAAKYSKTLAMMRAAGKYGGFLGGSLDFGAGTFDQQYLDTYEDWRTRGSLGLVEGGIDFGLDFPINLATTLGGFGRGLFNGKGGVRGAYDGWSANDIDLSQGWKDLMTSEAGQYAVALTKLAVLGPRGVEDQEQTLDPTENIRAAFSAMGNFFSSWGEKVTSTYSEGRLSPDQRRQMAKLQNITERNSIYSEILQTTDPAKRDALLEKLTELVEQMEANGNGGLGGAMINTVTNMSPTKVVLPGQELRIETADLGPH